MQSLWKEGIGTTIIVAIRINCISNSLKRYNAGVLNNDMKKRKKHLSWKMWQEDPWQAHALNQNDHVIIVVQSEEEIDKFLIL